MTSARLILKEPLSTGETLIFLQIRHEGKRMKYSTGEYLSPKDFTILNTKRNLGMHIQGVRSQVQRYLDAFEQFNAASKISGNEFNLNDFRFHLDSIFKKEPRSKQSFREYAEEYRSSTQKAVETLKGYKTTINTLEKYENSKGKRLMFEDVDLDFYDSFVQWCNEQNFAVNTIGSHIKNVKVFMDVAFQRGMHKNEVYKNKRFSVMEEEATSIYLTEEELEKIYNHDFSKNNKLDRVRDLFVIGCRTGLRFSDLKKLSADNLEDGLFKVRMQKTGNTVFIPLHPQVKAILDKYEYVLPRVLSNQKFNEYLKEVGKQVELIAPVVSSRTQGGKKVAVTRKKHELITTHTARRTFATLAYKAGVPSMSIRQITGHKSETSFLKYIKLTSKEHAELMAKHTFFK